MTATDVLLAVPNISEGRDADRVARIAGSEALLDIHSDPDHNRSVLTFGGRVDRVLDAVAQMIERAVAELDIRHHDGVHPRFGVVDVLPLVPYGITTFDAVKAAGRLIWDIAQGPGIPVYPYGLAGPDQRTLPDLRRWLRSSDQPAHPKAGVICLGVRDPLVAFNVNLDAPLADARRIAVAIRSEHVRSLAFELPSRELVQVSMNLIAPLEERPAHAFHRVAAITDRIVDAEVVGLIPDAIADETNALPLQRPARTIEQALRGG